MSDDPLPLDELADRWSKYDWAEVPAGDGVSTRKSMVQHFFTELDRIDKESPQENAGDFLRALIGHWMTSEPHTFIDATLVERMLEVAEIPGCRKTAYHWMVIASVSGHEEGAQLFDMIEDTSLPAVTRCGLLSVVQSDGEEVLRAHQKRYDQVLKGILKDVQNDHPSVVANALAALGSRIACADPSTYSTIKPLAGLVVGVFQFAISNGEEAIVKGFCRFVSECREQLFIAQAMKTDLIPTTKFATASWALMEVLGDPTASYAVLGHVCSAIPVTTALSKKLLNDEEFLNPVIDSLVERIATDFRRTEDRFVMDAAFDADGGDNNQAIEIVDGNVMTIAAECLEEILDVAPTKVVAPLLLSKFQDCVASDDWAMRGTGFHFMLYVVETMRTTMLKQIDTAPVRHALTAMRDAFLDRDNEHDIVRHTAIACLGEWTGQLSPAILVKHHALIIKPLLDAWKNDPVERNRAEAALNLKHVVEPAGSYDESEKVPNNKRKKVYGAIGHDIIEHCIALLDGEPLYEEYAEVLLWLLRDAIGETGILHSDFIEKHLKTTLTLCLDLMVSRKYWKATGLGSDEDRQSSPEDSVERRSIRSRCQSVDAAASSCFAFVLDHTSEVDVDAAPIQPILDEYLTFLREEAKALLAKYKEADYVDWLELVKDGRFEYLAPGFLGHTTFTVRTSKKKNLDGTVADEIGSLLNFLVNGATFAEKPVPPTAFVAAEKMVEAMAVKRRSIWKPAPEEEDPADTRVVDDGEPSDKEALDILDGRSASSLHRAILTTIGSATQTAEQAVRVLERLVEIKYFGNSTSSVKTFGGFVLNILDTIEDEDVRIAACSLAETLADVQEARDPQPLGGPSLWLRLMFDFSVKMQREVSDENAPMMSAFIRAIDSMGQTAAHFLPTHSKGGSATTEEGEDWDTAICSEAAIVQLAKYYTNEYLLTVMNMMEQLSKEDEDDDGDDSDDDEDDNSDAKELVEECASMAVRICDVLSRVAEKYEPGHILSTFAPLVDLHVQAHTDQAALSDAMNYLEYVIVDLLDQPGVVMKAMAEHPEKLQVVGEAWVKTLLSTASQTAQSAQLAAYGLGIISEGLGKGFAAGNKDLEPFAKAAVTALSGFFATPQSKRKEWRDVTDNACGSLIRAAAYFGPWGLKGVDFPSHVRKTVPFLPFAGDRVEWKKIAALLREMIDDKHMALGNNATLIKELEAKLEIELSSDDESDFSDED